MNRVPPAQHQASNPFQTGMNAERARLIRIFALPATLWMVSDAGYYLLLPALGFKASYNVNPLVIAAYYGLWIAIALIVFWGLFRSWWGTYENRVSTYLLVALAFAALVLFPGYALPLLPPISWAEPWHPPEVVFATPWYFLPKSTTAGSPVGNEDRDREHQR